jgi:hypothetical protein
LIEQEKEFSAYLGQSSIDHKVCGIDEAALIAGEEHHSLSLLNGFAKTTGWKVNLAAMTLRLVVAEPVLEQRSASEFVSSLSIETCVISPLT